MFWTHTNARNMMNKEARKEIDNVGADLRDNEL
jgi:hypothetical protein